MEVEFRVRESCVNCVWFRGYISTTMSCQWPDNYLERTSYYLFCKWYENKEDEEEEDYEEVDCLYGESSQWLLSCRSGRDVNSEL